MTKPQPEKNSRKIELFLNLYPLRLIWEKSLVQECLGDRGDREVCVSLWATETMGRRRELNILVCLGFHDKIPSTGWL